MHFLDITIAAIVAFFLIKGLIRGFFHEVFGVVGLVVALILATKYMSNASGWVNRVLDIPPTASTLLGFLLIFFGLFFAFQLLSYLLQKLFKYALLGWLEKLGGALMGFLKGATIVSLVLIFIAMIPFGPQLIPDLDRSKLYRPMQGFAPTIFDWITQFIPNSKSFYGELKENFENFSPTDLAKNTQDFLDSVQDRTHPQGNHSKRDEKPR